MGWMPKYRCHAYNIFSMIRVFCYVIAIVILWYRLFKYRAFIVRDVFNQILLFFGIFLFTCFEAWLGWLGVTRKHQPHILALASVLVPTTALELVLALWNFGEYHLSYKSSTLELMNNSFSNYLINYTHSDNWNSLQSNLHCCGLHGPESFKSDIPKSCCITEGNGTRNVDGACFGIYQDGCGKVFPKYIGTQMLYLLLIFLFDVAVHCVGIFFFWRYSTKLKIKMQNYVRRRSAALERQQLDQSNPDQSLNPDESVGWRQSLTIDRIHQGLNVPGPPTATVPTSPQS